MENRQKGTPLAVYFSSGSRPSRPTRITLLTDFAIEAPQNGCTLAGRPTRGLKILKLRLCTTGFTRIRKLLHNFIQSGDCLRRIVFGEGEAFLQKGSSTCIALRILLQDKIELRFRRLIFLLAEQGIAHSEMRFRGAWIVRVHRQKFLKIHDCEIIESGKEVDHGRFPQIVGSREWYGRGLPGRHLLVEGI